MKRILLLVFIFTTWISYADGLFGVKSSESVVSKYKIIFNEPPRNIPTHFAVDAPLLGNGFTGVAISGTPENQVFYLARNDFWRLKEAYNESFPCVLGKLELKMPAFSGASYKVEQDLFTGTAYLNFEKGNASIEIKAYVAATEDLFVLEFKNRGKETIKGDIILNFPDNEMSDFPSTLSKNINKNIQWLSREFDKDVSINTKAACSVKIVGSENNRFYLSENEIQYVVMSFSSNFKSDDCINFTLDKIKSITKEYFSRLFYNHKKWWSDYWNKSFININDSVLEYDYYRSLYIMGSASRDIEFPPGIFGTWVTKEPPTWCGDYHLNWNHHAPWYGMFSSNRMEQTLPYFSPIIAMQEKGREYGKKVFGIDGIMMPVGIGPKSMDIFKKGPITNAVRQWAVDYGFWEGDGYFLYQRSNALHCAAMMSMLCYYTYDMENIKMVYTFIKGVVDFFEGFATYENGRYVISNDAVEEGPCGDFNTIKTLGLLTLALNTLIDMSKELGIDEDKIPKWNHMLNKLSKLPTYERNGKTVFALSEKGTHRPGNYNRFYQTVFPGGIIHKDSNKKLLRIAKNTIEDDISSPNRFPSTKYSEYPSAVRLGCNPDTILTKMKEDIVRSKSLNGYFEEFYVGIEACGETPATINEMMLRSRPNIIDVFPCWNWSNNAYFQDLRSEGAFLVSSELNRGKVQYIRIVSEKGRDCNIVNPWKANSTVCVMRNGKDTKMTIGERLILKTSVGDNIIIFPWNDVER